MALLLVATALGIAGYAYNTNTKQTIHMLSKNNTSEELQHTNRSYEMVADYKNICSQPSLLKLYGATSTDSYTGLLGEKQNMIILPKQGLKIGGGIYRNPNDLFV